jgi:SAM-dependent methyltransferase
VTTPLQTHRDWYRTFFGGMALDVWRQGVPEEQTRAETEFLWEALRLRPGSRVLDVPCGAGRLSIPLAARGAHVTGIDLSAEQIERARTDEAAAHVHVEWHLGEMRDLPTATGFDAAFCFGNSFGYLDRDGTRAFASAIARALLPGGRFAMDSGLVAESILPRLEPRQEATIGDVLFVEENHYHAREGCLETRYTFVRGGESQTRTGLHWIFTAAEIVRFFEDAGLRVEGLHRSLSGEPFEAGSPLLVLVAARR